VGEREDVGFTVGIIAALYLFGGLVGVLVGMLIVGWLFRWLYERIGPWNRSPASVFVYGIFLWIVFLFLRFGALGFTILFVLQFELAGVIAAMVVLQETRARRLTPDRLDRKADQSVARAPKERVRRDE
jgi:MFS family permease